MKGKDAIILIGVVALVSASVIAMAVTEDHSSKPVDLNKGLIQITNFDLVDELGSSANGAIFFIEEEENIRVRIVADLSIVSGDKGGYLLYGYEYLSPSSVISGYNNETSDQYIEYTREVGGQSGYVYVDRAPGSAISKGGEGIVIVDYITNSNFNNDVDSISIGIQIGYAAETYVCDLSQR